MPDSKITALTSISTSTDPANDPLVIVDVSDTSMAATGTTKKVTLNQLLGASGTATLASATITGDLTVDTSTLKVDSVNNRVGVLNTPTVPFEVTGLIASSNGSFQAGASNGIFAGLNNDGTNPGLDLRRWTGSANNHGAAYIATSSSGDALFYTDSVASNTRATTLRMTLNSTGLGVGASPQAKLHVSNGATIDSGLFTGLMIGSSVAGSARSASIIKDTSTPYNLIIRTQDFTGGTTGSFIVRNGSTDQFQIDSSGNVGIGVTPSAWNSTFKALQMGLGGSAYSQTGFNSVYLASNTFVDSGGNTKYINTDKATYYRQYDGIHSWFNAVSGTAGNAFTATQAMTLDASGNLLVGTTDTSSTSGAGFKIIGSGLGPYVVNAASTNGALAYTMYSTGAAAYRFYVGWGGTVFATNTTISAISDARLKENVQDIDVGLGAILALKPRKFDWKAGKGKDIKGDRGFIAQEFEQVFPQLVDEWKDAAPEGEAPYKSVRQDLIPVLVKAIQELTARVQTLETR